MLRWIPRVLLAHVLLVDTGGAPPLLSSVVATPLLVVCSSVDVIHSWALPSLGIKVWCYVVSCGFHVIY